MRASWKASWGVVGALVVLSACGGGELGVVDQGEEAGPDAQQRAGAVAGRASTLVVLVQQSGTTMPRPDVTQVQALMDRVSGRFDEMSYGQVKLAGLLQPERGADVVGWLTVADAGSCLDVNAYLNLARAVVDPSLYDKRVVAVALSPRCTGALSARATSSAQVEMSSANLGENTLVHELGHTFLVSTRVGFGHANFLDCGDAGMASSGCRTVAYGDPYDVMGARGGHMAAPRKEALGWLRAGANHLLEVTASGRYVVEPLETNTGGVKGLKLQAPGLAPLYVEQRRPVGYDVSLGADSDAFKGALLHWGFDLVNTSPPALPYGVALPTDAQLTPALRPGQRFAAPGFGTLSVVSVSDQGLVVDVELSPPTLDLRLASPVGEASALAPATATLCWTIGGVGASCTASGAWTGTHTASSCAQSEVLTRAGTHDFTLECRNPQGSVRRTVSLEVRAPTAPPAVSIAAMSFAGDSVGGYLRVVAPGSVQVSWESSGATMGCTQTGAWSGTHLANSHQESASGLPVGAALFAVSCANELGTSRAELVVDVVEPPTARIVSPRAGAIVSTSTVEVVAQASDPTQVRMMLLEVDGMGMGMLSGTPPTATWSTLGLAPGPHTLMLRYQDTAFTWRETEPVVVTLTLGDVAPPTVVIGSIPASVAGLVTISATAADDLGVASVRFEVDGRVVGAPVTVPPFVTTWDSRTVPDGAHELVAVAVDFAGNVSAPSRRSVAVDNRPPALSTVAVDAVTATSARVSWQTDEGSTTQVEYGRTLSYGSASPAVQTLVTAHVQTLSGLAPATQYHLRVVSADALGNRAVSSDVVFTTLADTTAPTVSVTAPASGASVRGLVTVRASASDAVGVAGVQLYLDGAPLGGEDVAAPYQATLDTRALPSGSRHLLWAVARDAAGNRRTSSTIAVVVDNVPPSLSGISVAPSATSAVFQWTTSEPTYANLCLRAAGSSSWSCFSVGSTTRLTTAGTVTKTGLNSATSYTYSLTVFDAARNSATFSQGLFQTLP